MVCFMKIAYIIPSEDLLLGPDNELMIKGPLLVVPKEEFPAKQYISKYWLRKDRTESGVRWGTCFVKRRGRKNFIENKD